MTVTLASWCAFRGANLHLQQQARTAYQKALRRGLLTREACVVCGNPGAEGHHEDYAWPLEVVWLCRFHHSHRHQGASFEAMRAEQGPA